MTTATVRQRRTPAGVVGDVLLWLASVGGVICILLVVAAVFFHVTLIMFKTGSMEPTIPTGSLAVVHEIPASEVAVGDIVTVDRPGQLPITHRVTSMTATGAHDGTRSITLRGDANPVADPAPYLVDRVRVVWAWVPGWAQVVVWFSNPVVLGALTVGATALVTWAFWPRDAAHGRRRAARRGVRRHGRRGAGVIATTGTTLLAVAALVVGGAPDTARAAEVETVVSSRYLELTSVSDPDRLASMTRMVPVSWQVGVAATTSDPGLVHLGLAASGTMLAPGDFTIAVHACPVRWVAGVCAGTAGTWLPTTDLAAAVGTPTAFGAREIGTMQAADERWLMMTVRMTARAPAPGEGAAVRLQAWGVGDPLSAVPGRLASTGADAGRSFPPLLLALVAIGLGLGITRIAGRRREAEDA